MFRIKTGRAFGAVSFAVFTSASVPTGSTPMAATSTTSMPGPATAAGYTFDMVTKATSSSTIGGPPSGMTAAGIAGPDGSMRLDITALEGGAMSAVGDYYIVKSGKTMLVRPVTKTFVDIGDGTVAADVTFTGVTATSEKIAGADVIDGRPTEHLRTTVAYTHGIRGQSIPTTIVTDYWLVKLPAAMINPMTGVKYALTTGPMAALVNKQLEVAPPAAAGVPVKAVITTTRNAMGQSIVSTVTAEMKNMKEGNVDVSKIVMPEGFTKAMR